MYQPCKMTIIFATHREALQFTRLEHSNAKTKKCFTHVSISTSVFNLNICITVNVGSVSCPELMWFSEQKASFDFSDEKDF